MAKEYFGAEEWVRAHRGTIDRLEQLLAIILNPSVPDGTLIRLSRSGQYSLIEQAMRDHEEVTGAVLVHNHRSETPDRYLDPMPKKVRTKQRNRRPRAPRMTQDRIVGIVAIIDGWKGRLTWEALCDVVDREIGGRYTRQALDNYTEIKAAYENYNKAPILSGDDKPLVGRKRRSEGLSGKLRSWKLSAIYCLEEQFVRWAVNASSRNLDEKFLDTPLDLSIVRITADDAEVIP